MWTCDACHRHVMPGAPFCPFCASHRIAALAMAILAPAVLSACYGLPPCDDDELVDNDSDGYTTSIGSCDGGDGDCDDSNADVHPGAEEICDDDIDNNCDGIQAMSDGEEVCGNDLDDDCDGAVDEDCETGTATGTGTTARSAPAATQPTPAAL